MTVNELYDHIIIYMTPEEALKKFLSGSLIQYEKLKFDSQEQAVHPLFIITAAAMDLGWNLAVEKRDGDVRGLAVGTEEYLNSLIRNDVINKIKSEDFRDSDGETQQEYFGEK